MKAETVRPYANSNSLLTVVVASFAVVLPACGGGNGAGYGGTSPTVAPVAKVEISQTGLLLTSVGATRQLAAVAFDAQGDPVATPITWSSTTPSDLGIDSTGKVTAVVANGSSQIVAEAKGVRSAPLLAVVTTVPAGAVLLTDSQIVGDPVETAPDAVPSFANTYEVVLTGVAAPPVGTLLVSTESRPVLGRVVAVDTTGGHTTVTLGLVSLREAFPNLNINQVFDLRQAPVSISPGIAAAYDVKRTGDLFEFTPKPVVSGVRGIQGGTKVLTPVGTRALPPFTSCETTIPGFTEGSPLPIALSTPPILSVAISPTLDLVYTSAGGLERFVVKGTPTFSVQGGVNVTAAFEGKIECTVELFVFRVPVGGPLSFVVSGLVPVGVGLEAGGKITVATLGLGTEVAVTAKAEAGIGCPGGASCEFVRSLADFSLAMTPKLDAPGLGDLRVEPSLSAFGYLEADIGNPFLRSLRFNAFKVKTGGSLQGSFAPQVAQILDASYKSDYKVSLEAKAGVGTKLGDALSLLGLSSITALELGVSTNLATSPSGTVTADRATFVTGDTVHFRVQLDPATLDFFPVVGPYNVKKVVLVRSSGGAQVEVGSQDAIPRDATFDFTYLAPDSGRADEFHAFLVTWLVPLDLFALEIGSATATVSPGVTRGQSTAQNLVNLNIFTVPTSCGAGGASGHVSPVGATAWSDDNACESSSPVFPLSGVATTSFTERFVGDSLFAVTALSSGSVQSSGSPTPGGQTPCSNSSYSLHFSVDRTVDVAINAQKTGSFDSLFQLVRDGVPSTLLIDAGPGIESINQTVTLPPGNYNFYIYGEGCTTFGTLPSSGSFSFGLNLAFR